MGGSDDTNRIERDLEHTRARLDATLGALQQKLSPGQMVDEAMNWFKQGDGAEFGRNFGRSVRDNPIPAALIGVGVVWMLASATRGGPRRDLDWEDDRRSSRTFGGYRGYAAADYGRYGSNEGTMHQPMPYEAAAYDDLASKAHEAGARVQRETGESDDAYQERVYTAKGSTLGVTRQVGETLAVFRDRVETALEAAADRFRQMGSRVSDMARGAGSHASGMADRASGYAGSVAQQGRAGLRSAYGYGQSAAYSAREGASYAAEQAWDASSRAVDYVKDQPLLMGALGLAVGAVLGMLVPPTRYEQEIAEDLRRNLGEQARGAASEVGQRAMRVAEAVLDTAHESAQREGLTGMSPSGVAHSAREQVAGVAGRVRTVVEESLESGREALDRELSAGNKDAASGADAGKTSAERPGEHGDRRPVA
jgi:hypothetical protein